MIPAALDAYAARRARAGLVDRAVSCSGAAGASYDGGSLLRRSHEHGGDVKRVLLLFDVALRAIGYRTSWVETVAGIPATRWIRGLLALGIMAAPASLEARYSPETPGAILTMRGMPMTLGVCLLGSLMLWRLPVPRAGSLPSPTVPALSRSRWLAVILFVLFIFGTIPVGFQIAAGIVARIGHDAWTYTIDVVGGVLALLLLRYVFSQRELRHWSVVAWMMVIAALYGYFFAVLEVPVKRIHFMEYSFLSYLVFRALRPHAEPPSIYLWCVLAALLVGTAEEALSILHPRRFGAVSDVIWDTGGGALGALALKYVLLER